MHIVVNHFCLWPQPDKYPALTKLLVPASAVSNIQPGVVSFTSKQHLLQATSVYHIPAHDVIIQPLCRVSQMTARCACVRSSPDIGIYHSTQVSGTSHCVFFFFFQKIKEEEKCTCHAHDTLLELYSRSYN